MISEEGRNLCAQVVEQAKEYVRSKMETSRVQLLKKRKSSKLLEDDPEHFFEAVKTRVTMIFADMELMKEQAAKREATRKYLKFFFFLK